MPREPSSIAARITPEVCLEGASNDECSQNTPGMAAEYGPASMNSKKMQLEYTECISNTIRYDRRV